MLDLVSIPCYRIADVDAKLAYRCAGASLGCNISWVAPRAKDRVLKHAEKCNALSQEQRQAASSELIRGAPGAKLAKLQHDERTASSSLSQTNTLHPATNTSHSQSMSLPPKKIDLKILGKRAYREKLKATTDFNILTFICASGIPPTVVDLSSWKEIFMGLGVDYTPVSSTTLVDRMIPSEAALVESRQIAFLQKCENLTISFDGNSTRNQQSAYTVHVITPMRRSFLVEVDESSEISHTGKYIRDIIKPVSNSSSLIKL